MELHATREAFSMSNPEVLALVTQPRGAPGRVPPAWTKFEHLPEDFQKSAKKELTRIDEKKAYLIKKRKDVPKGTKIIDCTMPHKYTRANEAKSRACVRGDQMRNFGFESYSPTMLHSSLRTIISIAAALGYKIDFGDYTLAYLHAMNDPDECFYMNPPSGAQTVDEDGDEIVWYVIKSLYGAPSSGRNWWKKVSKWHIDKGFVQNETDPCVFAKKFDNGDVLIIGIYVDDTIVVYSSDEILDWYNKTVGADFDYNSLGPDAGIFGMHVDVTPGHITLSHPDYIQDLSRYIGDDTFTANVPAAPNLEELVHEASDDKGETLGPKEAPLYRSIVGAVLYVATTVRPDVSFAVGMLSRVLTKPTAALLHEAKRVVLYLVKTKDLGIRYERHATLDLFGMSDSSWSVRRSTSGAVLFLAGAAVLYISKGQDAIALSSTHAEIMAASLAALEAVTLARLVYYITGIDMLPVDMFIDNKGAVDMSVNDVSNNRSKHIERRHRKIRELVEAGHIVARRIATDDNVSDIFTKPLARKAFEKFRRMLLNIG